MNPDSPLEIIGSGFVPGIPGIYGNTTIPAPDPGDADAALSPPDVPAQPVQTTDIPTTQPAKAKPAKASN